MNKKKSNFFFIFRMLRVFRSLVQRRNFALSRALRSDEELEIDEGQLGPTTSWTPQPFELEEDNEVTDFEMPPKEYTEPRFGSKVFLHSQK